MYFCIDVDKVVFIKVFAFNLPPELFATPKETIEY